MSVLEQEQLLIDLIQHYPFLFDKTSKDFKDNNKKSNAWDSIATAMATTAENVQRVWKNLRERYAKERRLLKNIPSGSEALESTWPLFKYMGFMEKHVASRRRVSNVLRISSAASSNTSSPLCSPTGSAPNVWSTFETMVETDVEQDIEAPENVTQTETLDVSISETHEEAPPQRKRKLANDADAVPSILGIKMKTETMVEESLGVLTTYLKEKKKTR